MALQALEIPATSRLLPSLSYFDFFWTFGVAGILVALLVPWMRRSVVKRARIWRPNKRTGVHGLVGIREPRPVPVSVIVVPVPKIFAKHDFTVTCTTSAAAMIAGKRIVWIKYLG